MTTLGSYRGHVSLEQKHFGGNTAVLFDLLFYCQLNLTEKISHKHTLRCHAGVKCSCTRFRPRI